MKVLGVFSFIFGLGLLAFAGYGIDQESDNATTFGTIMIVILVLTGIAIISFVIKTFNKSKIYGRAVTTDDILDLPDHIEEEERSLGVSPFIIGCGIIAMIAGAIIFLYSVYALYSFVEYLSYDVPSTLDMEFFVIGGFFLTSLMLLIYCIRKLFFSRK